MGWFKKEEKVPEIPPVPEMPRIPEVPTEKRDLPELPSFPNNFRNESLNREMVKSAVDDETASEYDLDSENENSSTEIIPEPPKKTENGISSEINLNRKINFDIPPTEDRTKQVEPIFVRIDKFQSAQKNFDKIKSKTKEIENVLKKIKDVKEKEDREIQAWVQDLEIIKSRLVEIETDIFDKI